MPGVNVQFHMLFDEMVVFVADMSAKYQVAVELERFFPKPETVLIVPVGADLREEVKQFGHVDRFWFLCQPARLKQPVYFALYAGHFRDCQLAQAQFGSSTEKVTAFAILKKIAADLKRRTNAGIWVTGMTGITGYAKQFRVSEGATNASRSGKIRLVLHIDGQTFHVDAPEGWDGK